MPWAIKKQTLFFIFGIVSLFSAEGIKAYAGNKLDEPLIASLTPPFNASETHSTNIAPFYKWTRVLARMDADTQPPQPWLDNKNLLEGLPLREMAQKIDDIVNQYDYVADITNWHVSDYWETPTEFFAHGGDCEDFAIAKYAWLRFLGVSEDRLRVAIVHDRIRNISHAVLIFYIGNKAMILDSQVREIRDSNATSRYRLIYSINRLGWWHPTTPKDTRLTMMMEDMNSSMGATRDDHAIQFSKECLAGASLPECINAIEPAAR